ncbi:ferredoxin reductase family protein [soil metagenome]
MMKKNLLYLFFIANLSLIIYFWWTSPATLFADKANTLLSLGRLSGLLAVIFVLLQFVLMGRVRWVEEVFGLDKLARIHRMNGYLSISFILTHAFLITSSYAILGKIGFISQLVDFFTHYEDIWQAEIAVILFCSIVLSSIYMVFKRLKYEWWYGIHLLTYLAVILAWGHQLKGGSDFHSHFFVIYWYSLYIFVALNVLYFRFTRGIFLSYRQKFRVVKIVKEGSTAHSVYISGKNLDQFKTTPGQFISIRFLNKYFWQQHPFSLSWIPRNNLLRLTIKNSGDFTSTIGDIKIGTYVYLDGPFGSFRLEQNSQKFLFIAGGVGITPIRSLIEQAVSLKKDLVLLYSNQFSNDIILQDELDTFSKQYIFPIHYIVTKDGTWKGEKGRIDAEKLQRLVTDLTQREVYICGPVRMMDDLNVTLQSLGVSKSHIHYEKFSLH